MTNDKADTLRSHSFFERLTKGDDPLLGKIDQNAKGLLRSALSRLDVVSREEFDAQVAVLRRTRERLEALEAQIAALDAALDAQPPGTE